MKIGIVGSNERAISIARSLAPCDHELTFSDPSGEAAAASAAGAIGGSAKAQTPYDQAMCSEVLIFAIPWNDVDAVSAQLGPISEAIVVDAIASDEDVVPNEAESLARKLDSHRIVKAQLDRIGSGAAIPIYGDDPQAKNVVAELIAKCGGNVEDVGPLANLSEGELSPSQQA